MLQKGLQIKTSLLPVVSKAFEKFVNNRIVDHLKKCGIYSYFQYSFKFSRSAIDVLTVVSDRTSRDFNRYVAARAATLDIFKAFYRVWHVVVPQKLKTYGISGEIFHLICSFLSNRDLLVVLDGKSSQEYPVNAEASQGTIFGLTIH